MGTETSIETRVCDDGDEYYFDGFGIVAAEKGDVILAVVVGDKATHVLLSPEHARRLGADLTSCGTTGLVRRHGPMEALKRMLKGKGTTPREVIDGDNP